MIALFLFVKHTHAPKNLLVFGLVVICPNGHLLMRAYSLMGKSYDNLDPLVGKSKHECMFPHNVLHVINGLAMG